MRSNFDWNYLRGESDNSMTDRKKETGRDINRSAAKRRRKTLSNVVLPLEKRVLYTAFTGGDLVVERIGNGTTALSSASAPIYLDDYNPSAVSQSTPSYSDSLPYNASGTGSGAGYISDAGSSQTAGYISLSTNGEYLAVPGYQASQGITTIASTTAAADPREVDEVGSTGAIAQALTSTTFFNGSNIRGATTDGSGSYWTAGTANGTTNTSTGGINYYSASGNSNVEAGSSTYQYNTRTVSIYNGQLYYSTGSSTAGIYAVGTGTPNSSQGAEPTSGLVLADATTGDNPYSFAISPDGKTIYLADASTLASGGGILKYQSSTGANGSFTLKYTLGAFTGETNGELGLTVDWSAATPIIYATTSDTTGQKLIKVVDSGTGTTASATYTTLATASTNEVFRGVAFAPSTAMAVPSVVSVSPSTGPIAGGTSVTISGSNYNGVTGVYFNGSAASSYTVVNSTSIAAVSPSSGVGTFDVTVGNTTGTSSTSSLDHFTYTINPVISNINPTSGSTLGGASVNISGSNLATATNVSFGSIAATSFTYNTANSVIIAITPAESAGSVPVTVTVAGGSTATSSTQYTFAAPPTVTGLNLSTGVANASTAVVALTNGIDSGGNRVVIYGTNLSSVTNVSFGSTVIASTNFVYNSSLGAIVAISPPEPNGTSVNVVVTSPGGTSSISSSDVFTYGLTTLAGLESPTVATGGAVTVDSSPVIEQILVIDGQNTTDRNLQTQANAYTEFFIQDTPANGGGALSIFGNKDSAGTGSSLPNNYQPVLGTTISVTGTYAPYQSEPEIDAVTAISNVGTGTTYAPIGTTIAIANVGTPIPSNISGHIVTIQGVYLSGLTSPLDFNSSSGTITDTTGQHMVIYYSTTYNSAVANNLMIPYTVPTSTLVDVTGYIDVNASGFSEINPINIVPTTLAPIISSINPAQGPLGGTNTVTVTGYGLTGVTSATFGNLSGGSVTVINDNTLTVTAPAHVAGTVTLTVTNGNGASNGVSYLYTTAPVISSVSPGGENTSGGQPVVITGTGFTSATNVSFGTVHLGTSSFTVNSATQITVTAAPAESAGLVDITVTAPASGGGTVTSSVTTADHFIYDTVPTISLVSPTSAADNGGGTVVISGSSLLGTSNVSFGSVAATSFTYNSANGTITAVVPPGVIGAANITVKNYAGTSAPATFNYTATTVAAAQQLSSGTFVTIDSNPVISAILSQPSVLNGETYPYYAFLIDDGTGSDEIFYNPTKQNVSSGATTFVPIVGNTIKITGEVSPFNQIPEFGGTGNNVITYIANTGTAAVPAPLTETVSAVNVATLPLGTGFAGHLVTISNVMAYNSGTGSTAATNVNTVLSGTGNSTLTMNDGTGSMTLYYYTSSYVTANEQFAGSAFPAGPSTLTGFVYYTSGAARFVPVLDNSDAPTWLAPSSLVGVNAVYNPGAKTLYVNGAATITADPGAVSSPAITDVSNNSTGAVLAVNVSGGTVVHVGSISLSGGGTMTINASTGSSPVALFDAGALTIDSVSTLNLTNNEMDLTTSSGLNLASVNALISQGYNNGLWNGFGIISSTAATNYLMSLGSIINDTGANVGMATGTAIYSSMDGAAIGDMDILVKYTYYGDANLSGNVDGSDYALIDNGFLNSYTGWYNGDFNYDGSIDGSDYTLIDNAFNSQGTALAPASIIASAAAKPSYAPSALPTSSVAVDSFFSKKKVSESLIDQVQDLVTSV